jgi:hypothetical protein
MPTDTINRHVLSPWRAQTLPRLSPWRFPGAHLALNGPPRHAYLQLVGGATAPGTTGWGPTGEGGPGNHVRPRRSGDFRELR